MQNELLQCISEICHEKIIKDIREADFMAVIADETTDVATLLQLVIVFRYISKGKPVERFWKFLNPPRNDAQTLASCKMQEIDEQIESNP